MNKSEINALEKAWEALEAIQKNNLLHGADLVALDDTQAAIYRILAALE